MDNACSYLPDRAAGAPPRPKPVSATPEILEKFYGIRAESSKSGGGILSHMRQNPVATTQTRAGSRGVM